MHDCKGRLVAEGDVIKYKTYNNKWRVGVVVDSIASTDTCNLSVIQLIPGGHGFNSTVTAKESEIIVKADGSEPEAPVFGA